MKQNIFDIYITAAFSLIIPITGRLAFGLVTIVELNILVFLTFGFSYLLNFLDIDDLRTISPMIFMVFLAVFLQCLLKIFFPILAFSMNFSQYLICFSALAIGTLFPREEKLSFKSQFQSLLSLMLPMSVILLFFFVLRDVLGYGTLTLPASRGIAEIKCFDGFDGIPFFASIPFTFICVGLMAALFDFIRTKVIIFHRSAN